MRTLSGVGPVGLAVVMYRLGAYNKVDEEDFRWMLRDTGLCSTIERRRVVVVLGL